MLNTLIEKQNIEVTHENLGSISGYYLPVHNYKIVHMNHTSNINDLALQVSYAILYPNHDPFAVSIKDQDVASKFADFLIENTSVNE